MLKAPVKLEPCQRESIALLPSPSVASKVPSQSCARGHQIVGRSWGVRASGAGYLATHTEARATYLEHLHACALTLEWKSVVKPLGVSPRSRDAK